MSENQILVAGDTHGDLEHVVYLFEQAKAYECFAIVQVGDFGYWEHTPTGLHFLDQIEILTRNYGIIFCFIDGNHENHPLLRSRYMGIEPETNWKYLDEQKKWMIEKKGPWRPTQIHDGFWAVRKGLYYIARGTVWNWFGMRFAGLGGAYSIDIAYRKPGTSWWPEEMIEASDLDGFVDKEPVDILFTHDCPVEIDLNKHFVSDGRSFIKVDKNTDKNRFMVSNAVHMLQPSVVIHGHYHLDYTGSMVLPNGKRVKVVGLNMNGSEGRSFTIVRLKESDVGI